MCGARVVYDELFRTLNSAIHDFAKRQETWFRRMERQGVAINWVDGEGEPMIQARRLISGEMAGNP